MSEVYLRTVLGSLLLKPIKSYTINNPELSVKVSIAIILWRGCISNRTSNVLTAEYNSRAFRYRHPMFCPPITTPNPFFRWKCLHDPGSWVEKWVTPLSFRHVLSLFNHSRLAHFLNWGTKRKTRNKGDRIILEPSGERGKNSLEEYHAFVHSIRKVLHPEYGRPSVFSWNVTESLGDRCGRGNAWNFQKDWPFAS